MPLKSSAPLWGLVLLAAAPAAAQTPAPSPDAFPSSLDEGGLRAWLAAQTDMPPTAVVSIGSNSIIGLRSVIGDPAGPGRFQIQIRAEVVNQRTAAQGGYLSWSADLAVDCAQRRTRALGITNYPLRNLKGDARVVGGPAADWVTPAAGTQLYSLLSAVCDHTFRRPLDQRVAGAAPAPTAPAPRPAAPRPPAPPAVAAQASPSAPAPARVIAQAPPAAPAPVPPAPRPAPAPAPVATAQAPAPTPPAARPTPSPAPVVTARTPPPPAPASAPRPPAPTPAAPVVTAQAPPPPPAPAPPPRPAQPEPSRMQVAVAAPSAQVAAPPATAAPTFAPPPPTPEPPPAPPARRPTSKAAVQVAASDSESEAKSLGAKARRLTPGGGSLSVAVVKASVNGRTVYRALLHGFSAKGEAFTACEAMKTRGQACFVRDSY